MKVDFSVVIPALNLKPSLEAVLRCLEAQSYPADRFECIIVDDGSSDGTSTFLNHYPSRFQLVCITNPTALGRGAARNLGWKKAQGDFILFLDGDVLPSPNWIADYARAFKQSEIDIVSGSRYCIEIDPKQERLIEELAILAGTTAEDLFRTNIESQFERVQGRAWLGAYNTPMAEKFEKQLHEACRQYPESIVNAWSFVTANIGIKRSWLERMQGFNEFLRRGEDTDLGIRLWEAGARFIRVDDARTYHQSFSDEPLRRITAREGMSLMYRHPYRIWLDIGLWEAYETLGDDSRPASMASVQAIAANSGKDLDFDIEQEHFRLELPFPPMNCTVSKNQIVAYFAEVTGVSKSLISDWLDQGVARGLYTVNRGKRRYFDFNLSFNWLLHKSRFHEESLQTFCYPRDKRSLFLSGRKSNDPLNIRCKARYEISIALDVLNKSIDSVAAITNIPLPIENAAQSNLKFTNCWPPDLLDYIDADGEMISRYPFRHSSTGDNQETDLKLGYEFECNIQEHETIAEHASHSLPSSDDLAHSFSAREVPQAEILLKRITAGEQLDPHTLAKRIYCWVLDNISYHMGPWVRPNRLKPQMHALYSGFGVCIEMVHMFINLCRLKGIPARQHCAGLIKNQISGGEYDIAESITTTHSPYVHVWAEVYIPHEGWVPVDFAGEPYTNRCLSALNVADPQLREAILRESKDFDEYYFGTLDPYRIYTADRALLSPLFVEYADQAGAGKGKSSEVVRHHLRCEITSYYAQDSAKQTDPDKQIEEQELSASIR